MADDASAPTAPAREPLRVFISYRTDPDAPLAAALQRFIETSIEPMPRVFVAGNGGIRPSSAGFRQQITEAARKAEAFVAVITNASKEREWIFFEAGAAWGQNLMYVPLMIGTRARDLPNTIADYQALSGQNKDDMARLMQELAQLAGAEVASRQGQRFQAFTKAIDRYLKGDLVPEPSGPAENVSLTDAMDLAAAGKRAEAEAAFDKLETEADPADPELLCVIRVYRIQCLQKAEDWRRHYNKLPPELKETSAFHYFVAQDSVNPDERETSYGRCVAIGRGAAALYARHEIAKHRLGRGIRHGVVEDLFAVMRDAPKSEHSESAAALLCEALEDRTEFERLMILLAGLSGTRAGAYTQIADLAIEQNWGLLRLYCCHRANTLGESSTVVNNLGRARAALKMPSLAYQSFSKAAKLGAAVALCNMAQQLSGEPVPAAGLDLLSGHEGVFDAADRSFPYEVRGRLEAAVQKEEDAEAEFLRNGRRQFDALWDIASKALFASAPGGQSMTSPPGRLAGRGLMIASSGSALAVTQGKGEVFVVEGFGGALQCVELEPPGLEEPVAFVVLGGASIQGVAFSNFRTGEGQEWLKWEHATPPAPPPST